MKEYKEKEAKVAAISKGNELIKAEVLAKLQQAQTQIENEDKNNAKPIVKIEPELNDDTQKKTQQRKRKISAEKVEPKETVDLTTNANVKQELTSNNTKKVDNDVKPFAYKNVDYKKFYNHNVVNNKDHKQKQPKMKFKKYKN